MTAISASALAGPPNGPASASVVFVSRVSPGQLTNAAKGGASGQIFETTEGGFRATYPDGFSVPVKQSRLSGDGTFAVNAFQSVSERGAITVLYPSETPKPEDIDTRLDQSREKLLQSQGMSLESERRFKVGEYPSRTILANGSRNNIHKFLRVQYLITPQRWYEIQFVSLGTDHRGDQDIVAFFDSFEALAAVTFKNVPPPPAKEIAFAPAGAGFRVTLPAGFSIPVDQSLVIKGKVTGAQASQFISTGPGGVFLVTTLTDVTGMTTESEIRSSRDEFFNGVLVPLKADVSSSREVVRDGIAGSDIRFTGSANGQALFGRAFLFAQPKTVRLFLFLGFNREVTASEPVEAIFKSLTFPK